jgi:hypothetical protein
MSRKAIIQNHQNFEFDIDNIIQYGLNIIDGKLFHIVDRLKYQQKRMLLESLLLRSCALWESFVENELVHLVALNSTKLKTEMGLPQNTRLNLKLIRALLFSDTYRSYYNLEYSKSILNRILPDQYNLFKQIKKEQLKKISFVYRMRNYLSHYSAFAERQLLNAYKNDYNYKRFLEPGTFLMKQKGKPFENLIHNFKLTSLSMKINFK